MVEEMFWRFDAPGFEINLNFQPFLEEISVNLRNKSDLDFEKNEPHKCNMEKKQIIKKE